MCEPNDSQSVQGDEIAVESVSPHSSMKTVKSNRDSRKDFLPLDDYREALSSFSDREGSAESEVQGSSKEAGNGFASSQSSERKLVDEYFSFVASKGCTSLPWKLVQPAFMWKIKTTMDEMHAKEADKLMDEKKEEFLNDPTISKQKQAILRKSREFVRGAPFTIQRICELLTAPSRHYNSAAKFLRALERTIDVVTEVTDTGERITGAPAGWIMESELNRAPLENNFIGPVKEEKSEAGTTHDNSELNASRSADNEHNNNGREGGA